MSESITLSAPRGGRSLDQLISEVQRQRQTRRDYIAPTSQMEMHVSGSRLQIGSVGDFAMNENAHTQTAEYLGIPRDYYRRMQGESPEMLAQNVNGWLRRKNEKRLVRTLDGNARAVLSNKYRPLDNFELLESTLPVLMQRPDLRFASAEITESRLYLKIISDSLEGEVKKGDVIRMGLIVSNSEVGAGAILVAPFTERLVCINGAVHTALGTRKAHLGRTIGGDDEETARAYFTDETKKADDRAFFLKIRDTMSGILSGDVLAGLLEDMRAAAGDEIATKDVAEVVEIAATNLGLNETEKASTLENLIRGADLSRWGLANAITAAAKSVEDYDRSTQLQQIGGRLMSSPIPVVAKRVKRKVAIVS